MNDNTILDFDESTSAAKKPITIWIAQFILIVMLATFINFLVQEFPLPLGLALVFISLILGCGLLFRWIYLQKKKARISLIICYLLLSCFVIFAIFIAPLIIGQKIIINPDKQLIYMVGRILSVSTPIMLCINTIISKKVKAYLYK